MPRSTSFLAVLVPRLAAAARVALGAASLVPASRLVEASSVAVHTCLLASLCCFGFDLKIVNMVEEFQVE